MQDPVTENVSIVTGRPVRAKDGENHDAHLIVHMALPSTRSSAGCPRPQQLIGPAMTAHIAEHVALKYATVQRGLGVPVPPINLSSPPGTSIVGDQEQQQSDAIGAMAAQQMAAFMQQSGLVMTPPGQEDGGAGAAESAGKLELMKAQTWKTIADGLKSMAEAGMSLEQAMAAEAAIEAGQIPVGPAPGGPSGAFGAAPKLPPAGGAPRPGSAPRAAMPQRQHHAQRRQPQMVPRQAWDRPCMTKISTEPRHMLRCNPNNRLSK
jgi:hypothetical protein